MNRPFKTAALSVMTLAGLLTLALSGCLRDPYDDYEVVIPTIPGWEVASREHGLEGNLRKLFFVNPSDGFLIGYNGLLLQTSDSGKTWVSCNSGTDLHLGSIFFVNKDVGFISGRGADNCQEGDCGKGSFLLRTADGGDTWDKVFYDTLAYLESMVWRDASNGLGVMEYRISDQLSGRKLVRTDNAGNTWIVINQAIPQTMSPPLINFGDVCYLAGSDAVIKSTDFGLNWQTLQTPPHMTGGWYRIYFYNSSLGFIADNSAVYRTDDGGQTWQKTDSDMAYFDGMHFYDQNHGFCFSLLMQYQGADWPVIVGTYVYTTADGGVTWFRSDLFKGFYAGSLSFPTDEAGYGINSTNFHTFRKK